MKTVLTDHQKNVLLKAYGKLHDGLSDMVEEGRLRESDIPDDYLWLVRRLTHISSLWGRYDLRNQYDKAFAGLPSNEDMSRE